jgi:glycosyltransferase involved in cell wall biosynthesis
MQIAIYTMTRDRLDYTKRMFSQLKNCGVEYDHFVLDNGSTDGTPEWLKEQDLKWLSLSPDNKGLWRGIELILKENDGFKDYDLVLKLDNDLEFPNDNWLKELVERYNEGKFHLLSPFVEGIQNGRGGRERLSTHNGIGVVCQLGGASLLCKPEHYGFPIPNMGKAQGWDAWFSLGMRCGIVEDIHIKHDTIKQEQEKPDYYIRKCKEAKEKYV